MSSPTEAEQFRGGRSAKNLQHSPPQAQSASPHLKQQKKQFGCNDCRLIFQLKDESTILCRHCIATHRAEFTSYGICSICKDETYRGEVSPYLGARHRQEARGLEGRYGVAEIHVYVSAWARPRRSWTKNSENKPLPACNGLTCLLLESRDQAHGLSNTKCKRRIGSSSSALTHTHVSEPLVSSTWIASASRGLTLSW